MIDASLQPLVRSRVYAMLSAVFSYPDEEFFAQLANGTFATELVETISALYPDVARSITEQEFALRASATLQDLEAEYLRIFETGVPKPPVSLYESAYIRDTQRASILLELKSFFDHFGLTVASESHELEDQIVAELDFMQFLAAKEAQAIEGQLDAAPYRRAQRDFLARHLGRWLPAMAQSASAIPAGFYRSASMITATFVERDLASTTETLVPAAASIA
jgi:DMSO reductase family type II enzyme chaperone